MCSEYFFISFTLKMFEDNPYVVISHVVLISTHNVWFSENYIQQTHDSLWNNETE